MAQSTVQEDITRLQTQLDAVRTDIAKIQKYKEVEEGGNGGKHRTQYTNINDLYRREEILQTRLDALYRSIT